MKVQMYLKENPVNMTFVRREKGKLPYSVFKPHSQHISFLKSVFAHRPTTVFFDYPSYINKNKKCDRIRNFTQDEVESLYSSFKISDNTHIYNAVVNSCKEAGLQLLDHQQSDMYNLLWTGYVNANDLKSLNKL